MDHVKKRAKVDQKLFQHCVDYLEKSHKVNPDPSKYFMGTLAHCIEDEFRKQEGISSWDYFHRSDYALNFKPSFRKAVETVFGKGSWKLMYDANKKIRTPQGGSNVN